MRTMWDNKFLAVIISLLALAIPTVWCIFTIEPELLLPNLKYYLSFTVFASWLYMFIRLPVFAASITISSLVFILHDLLFSRSVDGSLGWIAHFYGAMTSFFFSIYVLAVYYKDKDRKNIPTLKLVKMSAGMTLVGFLLLSPLIPFLFKFTFRAMGLG